MLLFELTGKELSDSTIKRILKASGFSWKRIRKSVKSKRNTCEFDAAKAEIEELLGIACDEELELWFFDESGFDLTFSVPYAWQPSGTTIEVPSENSKRLNVLGFLSPDNRARIVYF